MSLDKSLLAAWKSAGACMGHDDHTPITQDLLYCGIMFLKEATKAATGCRPQSSLRLAMELANKRSWRLRLYRRTSKKNAAKILLPVNGHRFHV
jgi:hypothetical protein